MPSGEEFSASHDFLLETGTAVSPLYPFRNTEEEGLVISPNPAGKETTVSLDDSFSFHSKWKLRIYSSSGQLKLERNNLQGNDLKINLSGWEKGIYIVFVQSRTEMLTGKLVVKE
jgi:hypothetical protein